MGREDIETLISELHNQLVIDECSPQQLELMDKMNAHMHDWDGPEPIDPGLKEVLEILVTDVEVTHPKAAVVIHEMLDALMRMGI
ncbi:MAG: hypothetical protein COB04_04305 [Gammaproteobacteria bacterium]|nr:MAG: hypothetical protein COB04_04305 [Gammaproteobacteria bacterium]